MPVIFFHMPDLAQKHIYLLRQNVHFPTPKNIAFFLKIVLVVMHNPKYFDLTSKHLKVSAEKSFFVHLKVWNKSDAPEIIAWVL